MSSDAPNLQDASAKAAASAGREAPAVLPVLQPTTPDAPPPPIPDHELLRRIGHGSYGDVWLACNILGELRAVKIVHRATFEEDRPFEREFEGIRRFEPISRSHSSQLNILHVGRGQGYFYYVMELADGAEVRDQKSEVGNQKSTSDARPSDLRPLTSDFSLYLPRTLKLDLKRRGRLPPAECVEIGLALTTALAHLHAHGLVHRDIKPSNIIFAGGVPKLADIGLVTDVDASRSFVGTEGFLPPEGPGTPQADLYSLGKVLYEMSTGRDRKDYPALPLDWDALDAAEQARLLELNEVLVKVCEADPHRRYQTAEQLRTDLALLQRGQSVRRQRAVERRFAFAKAIALTAVGLGVATAVGYALMKTFFPDGQAPKSRVEDTRSSAPSAQAQLESLAVLPFDDESPDKADEYLSARLAEELSATLSKIPQLRILGPGSAVALKARADMKPDAQRLGLTAMLQGRVQKSGNQLRISAQLINPSDGFQIWSESYERDAKDFLGMQRTLALAVATALRVPLTQAAFARLTEKPPANLEAYNLCVLGDYWQSRKTTDGFRQGGECYGQAVVLDPDYVRAHLGLAYYHYSLAHYCLVPHRDGFVKARDAVSKAFELDRESASAHYWLATIKYFHEWDREGAAREFKKAIELNPNNGVSHMQYAFCLLELGRTEEAVAAIRRSQELDPLSALANNEVVGFFYYARQYDRALEESLRVIQMDPTFHRSYLYQFLVLTQMGQFKEAVSAWERHDALAGHPPADREARRRAFEEDGMKGWWRKALETSLGPFTGHHRDWLGLAQTYASLGDREQAFGSLQRAYEEREDLLIHLPVNPVFDQLRSDARFIELLRKVGLEK